MTARLMSDGVNWTLNGFDGVPSNVANLFAVAKYRAKELARYGTSAQQ
jgi:hypothetical protein